MVYLYWKELDEEQKIQISRLLESTIVKMMENESDQLVSVNIQYFSVNNDAGNGDPNLLSELKTKSFQMYEDGLWSKALDWPYYWIVQHHELVFLAVL